MIDLGLIGERYNIVNDEGETIREVSLLDLYYSISLYLDGSTAESQVDRMKETAARINEEYGTKFSWGEIASLFSILHDKMEESKKNSTDTLE